MARSGFAYHLPLNLFHLIEVALLLHQLRIRAYFHDSALNHDHDPVHFFQAGQPMAYENKRIILRLRQQLTENALLGDVIQ